MIVIAAIIYGFTQVGLPASQRDQKADQVRATNLTTLDSSVQSYYSSNKKLPAKLSDLSNTSSLNDPETGKMYEYKITGGTFYQLCATFKTDLAKQVNNNISSILMSSSKFNHPKGYHCFDLKVNISSTSYQSGISVQAEKKCRTYGFSDRDKFLTTYIVKQGDNFSSIATAQLGDASRAKELVNLNAQYPIITSENSFLETGTKLYLPPKIISRSSGYLFEFNGEITEMIRNDLWKMENKTGTAYYITLNSQTNFADKQKGAYKIGDCVSVIRDESDQAAYVIASQ